MSELGIKSAHETSLKKDVDITKSKSTIKSVQHNNSLASDSNCSSTSSTVSLVDSQPTNGAKTHTNHHNLLSASIGLNTKENKKVVNSDCSCCCCCSCSCNVVNRTITNSKPELLNGLSTNTNGLNGTIAAKRKYLDDATIGELFRLPQTSNHNGTIGCTTSENECSLLDNISNKLGEQVYSFPRLKLKEPTNENQVNAFVLQPSLFHRNKVPPTIYFNAKLTNDSQPPIGFPKSLQRYFRWKISTITPNSIRNCIAFMRYDVIKSANTTDTQYLGSWCKHMATAEFSKLEEWRKVNHYPGSYHMGRKDKLSLRLRSAAQKYNHDFDAFHPTTFILPRDYDDLCEYWKNSPSKLFIMKPPASARGNGVKVINDISQIPSSALQIPKSADGVPVKRSTAIVQQYISNPCLLENGQKFDLRVYVLLTSIDPLRIYVYEEGLVRFASAKYTSQEDGIIDQYMHLTNYFVNKNNQQYQVNNDCDSLHGCKWTLKRFWRYLREHYTHIDAQKLWDKIIDIIIKTIICCEGPMNRISHQNCRNDYSSYELFGFDIILDQDFKPWILEVNITPSLKSESELDKNVKYRVIRDMFNLVGYNLPPISPEEQAKLAGLSDCRLFFDRQLYMENLTRRDKLKHQKYQKQFKMNEMRKHLILQSEREPSVESSEESEPVSQASKISQETAPGCNISGIFESKSLNEQTSRPKSSNSEVLSDDSSSSNKLSRDSILSDLTQSDIRVLMLSEDELSRRGHFARVFPSATSGKYLKYFDKPRYYNLLLHAWEQHYKDDRMEGINRLSSSADFL